MYGNSGYQSVEKRSMSFIWILKFFRESTTVINQFQ